MRLVPTRSQAAAHPLLSMQPLQPFEVVRHRRYEIVYRNMSPPRAKPPLPCQHTPPRPFLSAARRLPGDRPLPPLAGRLPPQSLAEGAADLDADPLPADAVMLRVAFYEGQMKMSEFIAHGEQA